VKSVFDPTVDEVIRLVEQQVSTIKKQQKRLDVGTYPKND